MTPVLTLRPAHWPEDLPRLTELDTSFTTDQIYRVVRTELSFTLVAEKADPPLRKDFGSIADTDDRLQELEVALVAERSGVMVGFAAAELETWNCRMAIRHLYVGAGHRGCGIGAALLSRIDTAARSAGARCLWLDTPSTNHPAIQFYQHMGFQLCGLDQSFYDSTGPAQDEIALFFVRDLEEQRRNS